MADDLLLHSQTVVATENATLKEALCDTSTSDYFSSAPKPTSRNVHEGVIVVDGATRQTLDENFKATNGVLSVIERRQRSEHGRTLYVVITNTAL